MQLVVSNPETTPDLEWLVSFEAWADRCVMLSKRYSITENDHESAASLDSDDIKAASNGDHEAFRQIVERYQTTIATQMRRFSRDQRVLEELVHDVFVEAFVSLASFRAKSPFEHWLRKIAVRAKQLPSNVVNRDDLWDFRAMIPNFANKNGKAFQQLDRFPIALDASDPKNSVEQYSISNAQ